MSVGGTIPRGMRCVFTGTGCVHLGNLGLGHPTQARKQFQMFPASQQVEDGIGLGTVAHAAVRCRRLLGHAGVGDRKLKGSQATHAGLHGCLRKAQASRGIGAMHRGAQDPEGPCSLEGPTG